MNKVIHTGRLTHDPEIRYSQGEKATAIARFSLAVDRKYKREGEPTADFFNYTAFGKQAEFVEKYLKKGSKIMVTGHLMNNNYEKDGQKVYRDVIITEEIEFAESKKQDAQPQTQPVPQQQTQPVQSDGFMNIPTGLEEELPFS